MDSYTIFELYDFLTDKDIEIRCPFNKDSLIKKIEDNNLNIISELEPMGQTYWYPSKFGLEDYYICTEFFNITERDIIEIESVRYTIRMMYYEDDEDFYDFDTNRDNLRMVIKNIDTEEHLRMSGRDFMNLLDSKQITYERSMLMD